MFALITTILLATTPAASCDSGTCDPAAATAAAIAAATASTDLLSCELIESATGPNDSAMEFFTKSNYDLDGGFSRMLKQVRSAVGHWYYGDRTEKMTIEELNNLAEGLQLSTQTAPNGEVFQVVNLGFGGGNSATYFFENETTKLAPVMIVDGSDCYGPGDTVEFLNDTRAKRAFMRALRNDHSGPVAWNTDMHSGVVSYADARRLERAVREQLMDDMESLPEMKRIVREAKYYLGDDARAKALLEDLGEELDDMVVADFTDQMPLPRSWQPDYEIRSGTVKNTNGKLSLVGVSGVSAKDKEMIARAMGPVWDGVLQHRALSATPDRADLGYQNGGNGIIRVGTHTPAGSSTEYTVVDYKDVDDGSFTLYMAPSPSNPDKRVLTHIQFNN